MTSALILKHGLDFVRQRRGEESPPGSGSDQKCLEEK